MNNKLFFGLLILAVGVLVGWFVFKGNPPSPDQLLNGGRENETATPQPRQQEGLELSSGATGAEVEKGGEKARVVVTYTDIGFAPSPVTIKRDTTVTFVNESSRGMWVASDVHPTHQLLPGFDQLATVAQGGTYEYAFAKVGTWRYHNHVYPQNTGTVVVTQ